MSTVVAHGPFGIGWRIGLSLVGQMAGERFELRAILVLMIELLDALVRGGVPAEVLMPGTGCCALSDSVKLTEAAVRAGCGGVLMLPPFYYKGVPDEGLYRNFAEVIERVARQLVPGLGPAGRRWLGFRPSMPDSLPVISRAPDWKVT